VNISIRHYHNLGSPSALLDTFPNLALRLIDNHKLDAQPRAQLFDNQDIKPTRYITSLIAITIKRTHTKETLTTAQADAM
jgi:hypothetical protein